MISTLPQCLLEARVARILQVQRSPSGSFIPQTLHARRGRVLPRGAAQAGSSPSHFQTPHPRPPLSQSGSSHYLFSWSWMNFPKRLLLLFLRVQAFPTDHT